MGEIDQSAITSLPVILGIQNGKTADELEIVSNAEDSNPTPEPENGSVFKECASESERNARECGGEVLEPCSPLNSISSGEDKLSEREEHSKHLEECSEKIANLERTCDDLHRLCQVLQLRLQTVSTY